MARLVKGATGTANVVLPGGWVVDAGDEVVIPDEEWAEIDADTDLASRIEDLGVSIDPITPVPSFRDIQRAVSGGDVGLEAEIAAVNDALNAHSVDTTVVHGITDTAKLAWLQSLTPPSGASVGQVLSKTGASAYAFTNPTGATGWEAVYNFATTSVEWVINHARGTKAVHVETFDNADNPIEGNVLYPDINTVKVQFYFGQTGYARCWTLT